MLVDSIIDKLVIGTYEVNHQFEDTEDYFYPSVFTDINWIDTAITYDNDYALAEVINRDDCKFHIISKISPFMTDKYQFWVSNHLKCLNRESIDIMLVHNTRHESWIDLYGKILNDQRFKSVGISNASISELNQIKEVYGNYPEWLEVEINPGYLDIELIEFCKSNGIKVIAYAIFGGKYNARKFIQQYTLPYLIYFALTYSDKLIIRWDSDDQFNEIMESLHVEVKVNYDFLPISKNKSIVPNVYDFPRHIKLDSYGFPIYFNEAIPDKLVINHWNGNKFPMIKSLGLEFITEYQAFLRYNGSIARIAIIDSSYRLSKVESKDSKIYTKYEVKELRN